jgi:ribokinase
MSSSIVVVGSLNIDMVVLTRRMPHPGETLAGKELHIIPGGKGANQAVAASLTGASTLMIGCVGDDAFSEALLQSLRNANVDVNGVSRINDVRTGTATIIVEGNGKNRIIIIPGANDRVSLNFVTQKWGEISRSDLVLLQHEIPLPTIHEIIKHCHQKDIRVILNPAPMYPIPTEILALVDTLVLNETEAAALTGKTISGVSSAEQATRDILEVGVKTVIITLGELGAVLMDNIGTIYQPAFKVEAVDTTTAGDTFVGSYAASILAGKSPAQALLYASAASAIAVTRLGAQSSIPSNNEVEQFIESLTLQKAIPNAIQQKEV